VKEFQFRIFVPEGNAAPVEFYDDVNAYRIAVVDKNYVNKLPEAWNVPATYILVSERDPDGKWKAYVGKAPSGVKARLTSHARQKDEWSRALIVVRDTSHGLNSAQIGWLEGRLHEVLRTRYPDVVLTNTVQPGDKTLPVHDHPEAAVVSVVHCLRTLGYHSSEPEKKPAARKATPEASRKTKSSGAVSLSDIVKAGLLPAGTVVHSTNGNWPGTAVVDADGSLSVDGRVFPSPSSAGVYVCEGISTNGWTFWAVKGVDGGKKTLSAYREEFLKLRIPPTPPAHP
jgi:hypothetical protein